MSLHDMLFFRFCRNVYLKKMQALGKACVIYHVNRRRVCEMKFEDNNNRSFVLNMESSETEEKTVSGENLCPFKSINISKINRLMVRCTFFPCIKYIIL